MENILVELSKYIIIIFITIYTLYCFTAFRGNDKKRQDRVFRSQAILIYLTLILCNFLLYVKVRNIEILYLCGAEVILFAIVFSVYHFVYRNLSRLILNNMLMLLCISFIMLTRLSFNLAIRQFAIAAVSFAICIFVPVLIDRIQCLRNYGWFYGILGLILLSLVMVRGIGITKYGAANWIKIFGITLQPSEFAKIIFVFFIASVFSKRTDFKQVLKVSVLAAAYVILLVLEKDLGAALIFFVTYLIMLYAATRQWWYLGTGLLSGSLAAVLAYRLFGHVRRRVIAWQNPWGTINDEGYQVAQSLFAIGTGGWFGLGLGQGLPSTILVVESDFIFSAIAEELGAITAICIILICFSCFVMFINIAMKMNVQFYKLTALGLAILYGFQVFLTIGGVTKFIPSTGVTLPLVSYGGSSILSTIIIFCIIQGLYVLNQSEDGRIG